MDRKSQRKLRIWKSFKLYNEHTTMYFKNINLLYCEKLSIQINFTLIVL